MNEQATGFPAIRVTRRTHETDFEIILRPRRRVMAELPLPNRILSHFLDHFCKASGIEIELKRTQWPGSWAFDHVLCEDMGQLLGTGVAEIHRYQAALTGVPGRAQTSCCVDDALVEICMSLEGRPRSAWRLNEGDRLDGFVDAWFDESGGVKGWATGTNLAQFIDGFAQGAAATIQITAGSLGNLHHFFEALFRALGDASREAMGLAGQRLAGDTSGLAGEIRYEVQRLESGGD